MHLSELRAFGNVHLSLSPDSSLLKPFPTSLQVEQLSAFTAERHLAQQIDRFWTSDATLLVLQGEACADRAHIQLAKFLVDEHVAARPESARASAQSEAAQKHVVLVIHLERAAKAGAQGFRGFSFLCGWRQAAVDCLEPSENSVRWASTSLNQTSPLCYLKSCRLLGLGATSIPAYLTWITADAEDTDGSEKCFSVQQILCLDSDSERCDPKGMNGAKGLGTLRRLASMSRSSFLHLRSYGIPFDTFANEHFIVPSQPSIFCVPKTIPCKHIMRRIFEVYST